MRRFAILLALVTSFVHAQDDVTVAGRVVAADSAETLPFATITITRDGNPVAGAIADAAGRFVVRGLPRGAYSVTSSFIGFAPTELSLLIGERNDHYDLGDIALARAEGEVDEVIVSAQRQIAEANLDRRVFDLSQTFATTTGVYFHAEQNARLIAALEQLL